MAGSLDTPPTAKTQKQPLLRVAIVGGGIGGLCLAIGLLDYLHLDVQIYEAANAFSEIGAGVACGANAARALTLINPKLVAAYRNCATNDALSGREDVWFPIRHGQPGKDGEQPGDEIWTMKYSNPADLELGVRPRSCLHRADFLDQLVSQIPKGRALFGKAFKRFEVLPAESSAEGAVKLHFADDSTATADVVIGCDGIKSAVRSAMLKGTGKSIEPTYTGDYAYRALVPTEAAKKVLPEDLAVCGSIYCAYTGYSTNYPVSHGAFLNMIIIRKDPTSAEGVKPAWPHEQWQLPSTKAKMLEDLKDWHPGLLKLMEQHSKYEQWALFHLPHDESFVHSSGLIALMGDSAHAATPHMGAGAGQAIEDAFVLSRLLGEVKNTGEIPAALKAYDTVRRPRSQKLVQNSAKAMAMYTEIKDETPQGLEARKELEEMYRWVWEEDLEVELKEAISKMKKDLELRTP